MYIFVRHFVFENAPAQAQMAHAPLRHGARAQKRISPGYTKCMKSLWLQRIKTTYFDKFNQIQVKNVTFLTHEKSKNG